MQARAHGRSLARSAANSLVGAAAWTIPAEHAGTTRDGTVFPRFGAILLRIYVRDIFHVHQGRLWENTIFILYREQAMTVHYHK